MTENTSPSNRPVNSGEWTSPGPKNVQLIYILYFLGFVTGITVIIGVVMAYMNRGGTDAWLESHYTWLIRTFWIGILYTIIGTVLMVVLIGALILFAVAVWAIIRLVRGIQALGRGEPVQNAESWGF